MKKKYIIVCLFLLFFNMNNIYAADYEFSYIEHTDKSTNNKCEASQKNDTHNSKIYNDNFKGTSEFEQFADTICSIEGANCIKIDKVGIYDDQCILGQHLATFYLRDYATLKKLTSFLEDKKCGSDNCLQYINSTYCKYYQNFDKSTNNYKICNAVKNAMPSSTNTETNNDNNTIGCTETFKPRGTSGTEVKVIFNVYKNEDKISITIEDDGERTTLVDKDEKSFDGYNNILYFYGQNEKFETFSKNYIAEYKKTNACPMICFTSEGKEYEDFGNGEKGDGFGRYVYYTTLDTSSTDGKALSQCSQNGENKIVTGADGSNILDLIGEKTPSIKNCEELFAGESGAQLLNMLKQIITIVKIAIPLLLIGLGIIDFSKAVFAGSEDNMKKAQSKFLKRVIIGVCIFLIPTLLKVILTIANGIWPTISNDFCGIL